MKNRTDVIAYIDGFNLYNGLRDKYHRQYLWLDLEALCRSLLLPGQRLAKVKYFTAAVRRQPGSLRRQQTYWNALDVHSAHLSIERGRFQEKSLSCRSCGTVWRSYEEKETDVAIAVSLVEDAAKKSFGTALLLSADSDLCPAVRSVRRLHPSGKVVAAFPPARRSDDMRRAVDASFTIGERKLRASLLPHDVRSAGGKVFSRPASWK
jgi:uncharacterized LabA/DUF88 family protein